MKKHSDSVRKRIRVEGSIAGDTHKRDPQGFLCRATLVLDADFRPPRRTTSIVLRTFPSAASRTTTNWCRTSMGPDAGMAVLSNVRCPTGPPVRFRLVLSLTTGFAFRFLSTLSPPLLLSESGVRGVPLSLSGESSTTTSRSSSPRPTRSGGDAVFLLAPAADQEHAELPAEQEPPEERVNPARASLQAVNRQPAEMGGLPLPRWEAPTPSSTSTSAPSRSNSAASSAISPDRTGAQHVEQRGYRSADSFLRGHGPFASQDFARLRAEMFGATTTTAAVRLGPEVFDSSPSLVEQECGGVRVLCPGNTRPPSSFRRARSFPLLNWNRRDDFSPEPSLVDSLELFDRENAGSPSRTPSLAPSSGSASTRWTAAVPSEGASSAHSLSSSRSGRTDGGLNLGSTRVGVLADSVTSTDRFEVPGLMPSAVNALDEDLLISPGGARVGITRVDKHQHDPGIGDTEETTTTTADENVRFRSAGSTLTRLGSCVVEPAAIGRPSTSTSTVEKDAQSGGPTNAYEDLWAAPGLRRRARRGVEKQDGLFAQKEMWPGASGVFCKNLWVAGTKVVFLFGFMKPLLSCARRRPSRPQRRGDVFAGRDVPSEEPVGCPIVPTQSSPDPAEVFCGPVDALEAEGHVNLVLQGEVGRLGGAPSKAKQAVLDGCTTIEDVIVRLRELSEHHDRTSAEEKERLANYWSGEWRAREVRLSLSFPTAGAGRASLSTRALLLCLRFLCALERRFRYWPLVLSTDMDPSLTSFSFYSPFVWWKSVHHPGGTEEEPLQLSGPGGASAWGIEASDSGPLHAAVSKILGTKERPRLRVVLPNAATDSAWYVFRHVSHRMAILTVSEPRERGAVDGTGDSFARTAFCIDTEQSADDVSGKLKKCIGSWEVLWVRTGPRREEVSLNVLEDDEGERI